MSTLDGHSALHPLHSRHKSMTSWSRRPVKALAGSAPDRTASKAFARPRVECSSSRVAMYEGHMVPSSVLRHTPTPLHISTAAAKPPWLPKSSRVRGSQVTYCEP